MTQKYFVIINEKQEGPFSLQELSELKITNETPIWFEGMGDWQTIKEVAELKYLIKEVIPPPFQGKSISNSTKVEVTGTIKTEKVSKKIDKRSLADEIVFFFKWIGIGALTGLLISSIWFLAPSDEKYYHQKADANGYELSFCYHKFDIDAVLCTNRDPDHFIFCSIAKGSGPFRVEFSRPENMVESWFEEIAAPIIGISALLIFILSYVIRSVRWVYSNKSKK